MSLGRTADALDQIEPRWRKRGYSVIRNPRGDQLPDLLGGYQPDAIAVGRSPNLVIEVLDPRSVGADYRLRQLSERLDGQKDWQLEVVYAPARAPDVTPIDAKDLYETVKAARELAISEPRGAFLLSFAALEAAVRLAAAPHVTRSQRTFAADLNVLLESSVIEQEHYERLLNLHRMRAQLAHGQLDLHPTVDQIEELAETAEFLVGLT